MSLPTSDELADLLRDAAERADLLGHTYHKHWLAAKTARINRDLAHDGVVVAAYASGLIDGKNEAIRAAQLADVVNTNSLLTSREANLRGAEAEVKQAEGLLEAARVYRAALHDLVDLRVAELGVVAATMPRQAKPRQRKEKVSETV